MEAIIKIEDYRIHCVVGTHPHERNSEQELSIDLELKVDISESVQTDSIVDTVNYDEVASVCRDLAKQRQYHLLETLAYEALHAVMDTFPILWAKIRVRKKHAIALSKAVTLELEKER